MLRGGGWGWGRCGPLSVSFFFVPQEKNITAKLARLGQVWGGKRYIEGQAGGGGFGKTKSSHHPIPHCMIIFEVEKALCKFKNCNQMGKSSHRFLSIGGNTVELWAEEVKHNAIVGLS